MNRHYHGASHLGRCGVEADPLTIRQLYELPITRDELETLATWIAALYDVALFRNCLPQIAERERQLSLIAETADLIV